MSKFSFYIYKIKTTPKSRIFKRVCEKVYAQIKYRCYQVHDAFFDTRRNYRESRNGLRPLAINLENLDLSGIDRKSAEETIRMYTEHRFDLLGSGWVKVEFSNHADGLSGYKYNSIELKSDKNGDFLSTILSKKNLLSAKKIWNMIEGEYQPIDWQKDLKTGYRWGADKWYLPQGNAKKPGGDIKAPWELSRLQHLPRLAIFSYLYPEYRERVFREFRNQVVDFIAQNPVRMGVNYMCTMDVGIRTANLALAYSLFKNQEIEIEQEFEYLICNSMFEHCNHIRKNLEWSEILTSNHYFANIAGLLYGSAVLPRCRKRDKWLEFSVDQINKEIRKQFWQEGSNREGSTAYHRLTGEMALYSVALVQSLFLKGECKNLDEDLFDVLYGSGKFIQDITRKDGGITQIGDNDSGVFFKLSVTGTLISPDTAVNKYENLMCYKADKSDIVYLDEDMNDCRTFVSGVAGMFGGENFKEEVSKYPLEYSLVSELIDRKVIKAKQNIIPIEKRSIEETLPYQYEYEMIFEDDLLTDICRTAYSQFGIYIYKSQNMYLCINASDNGQKGNAGHAHNDKLSFELFVSGKSVFEDSGVFVYTALPEERNRYRSTKMHNTIYLQQEQNDFINLFSMKSNTKCYVSAFEENKAIMWVIYKEVIHKRIFLLERNKIVIKDYCNKPFEVNFTQGKRTRGYGKVFRDR